METLDDLLSIIVSDLILGIRSRKLSACCRPRYAPRQPWCDHASAKMDGLRSNVWGEGKGGGNGKKENSKKFKKIRDLGFA